MRSPITLSLKSGEVVTVEQALAQDSTWIKLIYREHKKHLGNFNLYNCWDTYLKTGGENGQENFLVIRNKGFVRFSYMKKFKMFCLHDLGVFSNNQNRGYGTALLEQVPLPFFLRTNQDNKSANDYYVRQGLIRVGEVFTMTGRKQNVYQSA